MKLSDKQAKFARMIALLILQADALGYRVRFADAYRDPRVFGKVGVKKGYGRARSLHKSRLAVDLVLDKRIGDRWVYQRSTTAYTPLGEYWESIGGSWGGRFSDGNHFSLEHGGRR